MSPSQLESLFAGFCAVSGSPVWPSDYNRYRLNLDTVTGGKRSGFMHYCCWPCVCDAQDFIRVDTKTVPTAEGPKKYHFAVLGNPCDHPEKLREPFVQPFSWGRETTLEQDAPEVRCEAGRLLGATMSDHGYVIISLFFDIEGDPANAPPANETGAAALAPLSPPEEDWGPPQPGRVRRVAGVLVQVPLAGRSARSRARRGGARRATALRVLLLRRSQPLAGISVHISAIARSARRILCSLVHVHLRSPPFQSPRPGRSRSHTALIYLVARRARRTNTSGAATARTGPATATTRAWARSSAASPPSPPSPSPAARPSGRPPPPTRRPRPPLTPRLRPLRPRP